MEKVTSTRPDETVADENTSVQNELPEESMTLQTEESYVSGDGGGKHRMVVSSNLLTGRSGNVSVGSVHLTQLQPPLPKQH